MQYTEDRYNVFYSLADLQNQPINFDIYPVNVQQALGRHGSSVQEK